MKNNGILYAHKSLLLKAQTEKERIKVNRQVKQFQNSMKETEDYLKRQQ